VNEAQDKPLEGLEKALEIKQDVEKALETHGQEAIEKALGLQDKETGEKAQPLAIPAQLAPARNEEDENDDEDQQEEAMDDDNPGAWGPGEKGIQRIS